MSMSGTVTPIRQSCDRCRGQKLRCERDEERDTGACTRCIRLGSQCVYSHSLPKGRPNQYSRHAEPGAGANNNGYSGGPGGVTNVRGTTAAKRKVGAPIAREAVKGTSRGDGAANAATSQTLDTAQNPPQLWTDNNGNMTGSEEAGIIDPLTSSAKLMPFAGAPILPWLGHWSWSDSMLDEEEIEGFNAFVGDDPGLPMQYTLFDEQLAALPEWGAANTRGKAGPDDASQQSVSHVQESPLCIDVDMLESRRDSGGSSVLTPASDATSPGAALAQLTQLSMRLHPLHSSSQALADNACWPSGGVPNGDANWKSKQAPAVDEDVFGGLMTHLLQDAGGASPGSGSVSPEPVTLGGILQDAMFSTHQLLKTMANLQQQQQQRSKASNSPLTPVPTPNSSRTSRMGNPSSSPVVRHLITSCHGMLVSIYTAIFEVLQRDADWLSHMRRGELGLDNGPLGDMRLVVIVQLCAYLVYRQQAAVDAYVSPGTKTDTAANELESEMRLGLDRLRSALSIR